MPRFRNIIMVLLVLVPTSSLAATAGVEEVKSIARLYSAAFNRIPRVAGLNFWVNAYQGGRTLLAIAGGFYKSPESALRYGRLTDRQYVEQLYLNVLGRPGEKAGVDFWAGRLSEGVSRAGILAQFAESPENVSKTTEIFADMRMINCQWVFGPAQSVSGITGCMVGPAVAGVAYNTPTHQGVTGPGGDFHYEHGETVRFTLGDTPLGEVTAQARITLFDLAGSAVITGTPNIIAALGNKLAPFQSLINLTVLLQSLDYDADPRNGIEITSEVAALFQGLSLDVGQHWETFPSRFGLRHAIAQANRGNLFNEAHGIVNPAPALQSLYRSLGIDARTLALALEQRKGEEDVSYEYDTGGNLARVTVPTGYGEEDPLKLKHCLMQEYEYDAAGNRIRFEERSYSAISLDFDDSESLLESRSVEIETRLYDAIGLVQRIAWEGGEYTEVVGQDNPCAPGEISIESRQIETLQYDADGYVIQSDSRGDFGIDGSWQYQYGDGGEIESAEFEAPDGSIAIHQYEEGRLVLVEVNGPRVPSTVLELGLPGSELLQFAETYSVAYEYDADGNLTRDIREGFNANLGRRIEIRQYDLRGKLTRFEAQTNENITLVVYRYEYDDYGQISREITDEGGDGTPEKIVSWYYEYDERGNVILVKRDGNSNGTPDKVQEFDGEGYLIRERGPGKDISFHYEGTGWGHIFSPRPLKDPTRCDRPFSC